MNPRSEGMMLSRNRVVSLVASALIVLGVPACGLLTPIEEYDYDALEFEAEVEVVRDSIRYTLFVRNTSSEQMTVESSCDEEKTRAMIALRIYESTSEGGQLLWDSSIHQYPEGICGLAVSAAIIPGGEVIPLSAWEETSAILGDSIPAGTYRLAVMPNFNELFREREVSVGMFALEP